MALSIPRTTAQQGRLSPKRKRNETIPASESLFAPDLPSSRTTIPSYSPSPPPSPSLRPSHPLPSSTSNSTRTSTPLLQIPLLEQEVGESDAGPGLGADSPRSAVARKLEGLDLAVKSYAGGLSGRAMPILSFGDAEARGKGGERKKLKLSPAPTSFSDNEDAIDPSSVRAGSPTNAPRRSSSSPDGASINWWADSEITGHLGEDPEDDGYGINGIGFKPTPAMAAARSLKRRRQIEEWRGREMREERRRRAEGRRGRGAREGSAGVDPGGGGVGGTGAGVEKRSVRFVGS